MAKNVVLIILDGWGVGPQNDANVIYVAKPAIFEYLTENYPVTSLQASGISVGLPWGETGNSEVGHLTLGAGKVIYQYYPKITMAIQDRTFFENAALKSAFAHAKKNNSGINLVGLLSQANTHASLGHLQALIKMAEGEGVSNVKLHLFADGLDSPPGSLLEILKKIPADKLASLTGRYYAMDRNQNWSLVQRAYDCMVGSGGAAASDLKATLDSFYAKNQSEEFLPPLRLGAEPIKDGDAVIFFNFREDSMRELLTAFAAKSFDKFPRPDFKNLHFVTLTKYKEDSAVLFAFPADAVEQPLGQILSEADKTQLRLAETYKYAHVTYFFNGYREPPAKKEYRVLVPSLNITHPDEKPELMASAVTDRLLEAVHNRGFDFILVNYSNPDTIGHTGNYNACLEAVRVMDREVSRVVQAVEEAGTTLIITSDHGNIEQVISPITGELESQHDSNPVPFHLIAPEFKGKKFPNWQNMRNETLGILSDVAPTILELMELPPAPEMTGKSLLSHLI